MNYQRPGALSALQHRWSVASPAWHERQGTVNMAEEDPRDRQDNTAIAQAQAILALAREVSQLKAGLAEVQAALSSVYEALDSIEHTIGQPRYH